MQRLRHRPDYFVHRGNRMAYHRHQDGATFSRLDPYAAGEQSWLLNSGRVIFVTAAEVRDIAKQVNDQDLPDIRPTGDWDEARIQAIEERLAALEASSNLVERESVAPGPIPDDSPLVKDLRARIAELEAEKSETSPPSLPPDPAGAKLSDYGEVGDPAEREITTDHMLETFRADAVIAQEVIAKLSQDGRQRMTELLNVEKVDLRNKRNAGQATDADLARLGDVDRLLNLFARVGEK